MNEQQTAAMRQALKVMDRISDADADCDFLNDSQTSQLLEAITALRQALEPVQMRRTTRAEKIVNPGVYEAPVEQQPADDFFKQFQTGNMRMEADEPVAWMSDRAVGFKKSEFGNYPCVPLYTRPQPAAPLWRTNGGIPRFKVPEQPCKYPKCPYPCPDLPDCNDAEQQPASKTLDWWALIDENQRLRAELKFNRHQPAAQFAGSYGTIDESAAKRIATALGWEPKREWVGLTQQDIDIAFDDTQEGGGFNEFARAIEAKLKEKNA